MKYIVLILMFAFLVSCGGDDNSGVVSSLQGVAPGLEVLNQDERDVLKSQLTTCEDNCPESVAKIIVFDSNTDSSKESFHFCTGVLVGRDMILTSSTCLGEQVRTYQNCNRIFALFPSIDALTSTATQCLEILSSTSAVQWKEGKKELWRNDYALLKVNTINSRQPIQIDLGGVYEDKYEVWSLNQESKKVGEIKKQECRPLLNSYINPFAQKSLSPFIPFGDCKYDEELYGGNAGGAILSRQGKLVGIVSSGILKEKIDIFKREGWLYYDEVNPIVHATNVACLDFPTRRTGLAKECLKPLSSVDLFKEKNKIFEKEELYTEAKEKITHELLKLNKFFQYKINYKENFEIDEEGNENIFNNWLEPVLSIECFREHKEWITMKMFRQSLLWWKYKKRKVVYAVHENWKIVKKLDRYFYPKIDYFTEGQHKDYRIEFSPKDLKEKGQSLVYFFTPPLSGQPVDSTLGFQQFPDMKDCE